MQKVSNEYRESMKSSLRERGYIMLSFGLVNQEAQAKARIEKGNFTRYSNTSNIFGKKTDDTIYATLEKTSRRLTGLCSFFPEVLPQEVTTIRDLSATT
jgi:hypothetical protein